jgi:predicted permease
MLTEWITRARLKLNALVRRRQLDRDLDDELAFHLQMREEKLGTTNNEPTEAHFEALRQFGNATSLKERSRGMWTFTWLEDFWQDIRFGTRVLRKNLGFTIASVLTLALAIGANTTIFSWMNATLFDPIPGMSRPSEGVAIENGRAGSFSYPDFADLRDSTQSFSGITAFSEEEVSLTGEGKPERAWASLVTSNYFDVLGVKPFVGRGFLAGEAQPPNGAPVTVISYRLWQGRFGGNPAIIGQQIHINTQPFTIVGVAPAVFQGITTGLRFDLWLPVTATATLGDVRGDLLAKRNDSWLNLLGRLRPGVGREQAQTELTELLQRIARQYPNSHKGVNQVAIYPLWRAPNGAEAFFYRLMPMLMGVAGIVLLLACVNIANLLLQRGVTRQKEMSIRLSLGAGRARLIRQLLVESLLLSATGGGIALALTAWGSKSLMAFVPTTNLPIWLAASVDRHVLAATLAITILTAILFGIMPALRASGVRPGAVLKEESGALAGGRRKGHLSNGLAVAQVALSLVLLVSAGLFVRSFHATQKFDPGFNPNHVLLESYDLAPNGYNEATGVAFDRQAIENVEALPGVQSACLSDWVPLGFGSNSDEFTPEGYEAGPHEAIGAGVAHISPQYFSTLGIALVSGRDFAPQDSASSKPVVIVNQALANRYWPKQSPLGKRMQIEGKPATVIGVASTTHYFDLSERPQLFLYLPLYQFYNANVTVHVRTAGDASAYAATIADSLHKLNAGLPVSDIILMTAWIGASSFVQRMAGTFVGAFGALALLLTAVGIYGVSAYCTRQRTHEIGIRMALGAQRADVLRLTLGQGARITLLGVGTGLLTAFGVAQLMSSLLYGVSATDPVTFAGVALLLTLVALFACYIPARRATRVDPMAALRHE